MISRRKLFKILSALPLGGLLAGGLTDGWPKEDTTGFKPRTDYRNFPKELGLRTFINAQGTWTYLTGSLMPPEVMQAIYSTSHQYVHYNELQDKVGERLAELCKSEAAMVTAGAASALTLGTAATITGTDQEKITLLPNLPPPQHEVIIQKSHRFGYDHAIRNTGIKFVEVESRQELEAAVNDRTVMMMFLDSANPRGQIQHEEFIELGRKHGIPTFNDAAPNLPPAERLWIYNEMGFDLVTFSGGKGLRGPQSAGLLCGRKDLIEAARLNASPNHDAIGRGMKVNKEEVFALLVAVERFIELDHAELHHEFHERVLHIGQTVEKVPGVRTEIEVPTYSNHTPTLIVEWDRDRVERTPQQVQEALRKGHPSIEVFATGNSLRIAMWMARAGEERVVASRLREELENQL